MNSEAAVVTENWESRLAAVLPLYGHRNWIVVADAAYPAQSKAGIETICADAGQVDVLRNVMQSIRRSKHVRANVYVDEELAFVPERDAQGVDGYRQALKELFGSSELQALQHEQIIAKLDQCAQVFRILIFKTTMTIPYTSVFFELECGYWDTESEERLRKAIQEA
jgi:D-ribose pyranose/furanose isomerase RbsD